MDPINAVKFVELPMISVPDAPEQGRVDAGILSEPLLSSAVEKAARVAGYPYDAFDKRSEPTAYFAATAWVNTHHDELRRFNAALHDASRYTSQQKLAMSTLTANSPA